jgi:hypothetical protein
MSPYITASLGVPSHCTSVQRNHHRGASNHSTLNLPSANQQRVGSCLGPRMHFWKGQGPCAPGGPKAVGLMGTRRTLGAPEFIGIDLGKSHTE